MTTKRTIMLLLLPLALLVALGLPGAALAQDSQATISAQDDEFDPVEAHVTPGTTIVWSMDGANQHTVTADDGAFDSGLLDPGKTFSITVTTPGQIQYYCTEHGGPGGQGMAGLIVVTDQ
jgi:plastocyanin